MLCKLDTVTSDTVKLKLVTILVGFIDVILAAVSSCGFSVDIYFLVIVLVFFSLSVLLLLCIFLDMFKLNCTSRGMDFLYHILGGLLVSITSIILLANTQKNSCGVMEKTAAATIGIFNAGIYIFIAWRLLQQLRTRDSVPYLPIYIFCICSRTPVVDDRREGHYQLRAEISSMNSEKVTNRISLIPNEMMIKKSQTQEILVKPKDEPTFSPSSISLSTSPQPMTISNAPTVKTVTSDYILPAMSVTNALKPKTRLGSAGIDKGKIMEIPTVSAMANIPVTRQLTTSAIEEIHTPEELQQQVTTLADNIMNDSNETKVET